MAAKSMASRCCYRSILDELSLSSRSARFTLPARPLARPQSRTFTSSIKALATALETSGHATGGWEERTRLTPASPSYFTGSADFFDNWLALQELLRTHQTLPQVPPEEAPRVKWKTLNQYRSLVGSAVKAAKYKKIILLLNRINRIDPTLLPEEAKGALEFYKRDLEADTSKAKEKTLDNWGRGYGTGRRKTSVARVFVVEGDGQVLINGKSLAEAFDRQHDRESAVWPLLATSRLDKYNVWATVEGGGKTGQAEALTLGVAKALLVHEPDLKPALRRAGCITRDPRSVERKKPGHVKARKMPTWVKR
ncbi:37S ribosomal protein S9, mitochondrial [Rhizina undulata]